LRSLEEIKPDYYSKNHLTNTSNGISTNQNIWLYTNLAQKLKVSISNYVGVVTFNKSTVRITYDPKNSQITMTYYHKPATEPIQKTFTLDQGSNLKAIFERDSSPTE